MSDVKQIVNKILEGADVRTTLSLKEDLEFYGLYKYIRNMIFANSVLSDDEENKLLKKLHSLELFIEDSFPFEYTTVDKVRGNYEKKIFYKEPYTEVVGRLKLYKNKIKSLGLPLTDTRLFTPNSRGKFVSMEYYLGNNIYFQLQLEVESDNEMSILYVTCGVTKKI